MRTLPLASLYAVSFCCANLALADTPFGWLSNENPSAYTTDPMKFELSIGAIAVNDSIDFLDIRDDLLAGTRKLEGDSGDLSGRRAEINFGITSYLSAFYRRQEQDLKIELGDIRSINLIDIDDGLNTTSTAYGIKWVFFESTHNDKFRPWRVASLELTRTRNFTDDYEGMLDRISLNNDLTITFTQAQTFRVRSMEDDGWQARLLYSFPLNDALSITTWAGYAKSNSTSGTGSDIANPSLAPAFEQSFDIDDQQILAGVGLNWQITPRIPLQLNYEYIKINDTQLSITDNPSNVLLPSFLRANNLSKFDANTNHTLRGDLSYWITPKLNVSLTGKVFSNQFLGLIPHYTNPLTGSFSDKPYGYAGISIGIAL